MSSFMLQLIQIVCPTGVDRYCRICKIQFEYPSELRRHQLSSSHREFATALESHETNEVSDVQVQYKYPHYFTYAV